MISLISAKGYQDEWRICAVVWGNLYFCDQINEIAEKLNINSDKLKTELIKNWDANLSGRNVYFDTQEKADKVITEYLQPQITAITLAG